MWLGRKTVPFESSFMVWFSLALTILKFSERPFSNIAQGQGGRSVTHSVVIDLLEINHHGNRNLGKEF